MKRKKYCKHQWRLARVSILTSYNTVSMLTQTHATLECMKCHRERKYFSYFEPLITRNDKILTGGRGV